MKSFLRQSVTRLRRKAWFAKFRNDFVESESKPRRPAVFVDLSVIVRHDARTGIQRAVRGIWSELNRFEHPRYDFIPIYAGAAHGYCHAVAEGQDGRLRKTGRVVRGRPHDKFLGLDLAAHYIPHCAEQLSAWKTSGIGIYHVVYDLLPLKQPAWFMPATSIHFAKWFETLRRLSDKLLCISEAVAGEVRSELRGAKTPAVDRLFLSGDIAGSDPSRGLTSRDASMLDFFANRDTVLMVGTIEPRKGYDDALAAFEWLWETMPATAPNLVIVGKPGWHTGKFQERIRQHPMAGKRLQWHATASDEALGMFYDRCTAVLVTSRGEGFGLPLSEAAHHGKWVLARDLPVFREQQLPNCLYFDDGSAPVLGKRIADLVLHARQGPPARAPLPDWEECLRRLLVSIGVDSERVEDSVPA